MLPPLSDGAFPWALYRRHLGLPAESQLEGPAAALAAAALEWYRAQGRPSAQVVRKELRAVQGERVLLDGGVELHSAFVANGFREAHVHAVAILAATAGAEVDEEVDRLWKGDRPDEAMFLSALAVAVVEELRDRVSAAVAAEAARAGAIVLPRYAPGYDGWDLAGLEGLVAAFPDPRVKCLPGGGLSPQRSTVVAVGLTREEHLAEGAAHFWSRRQAAPAAIGGAFAFPESALKKWSRERLEIRRLPEGRLHARFRFDGKTCASAGTAFAMDYTLELEERAAGAYRIAACACAPAPGDAGHRAMCASWADAAAFQAALRGAPPIIGEDLDRASRREADESPAACLCTIGNRNHKWKIVLQTLEFALSRLKPGEGIS